MSLPSSASPSYQPTEKPETNIFTIMLLLSFVALVTGCVLMHLELQRFGPEYPFWKTPPVPQVVR
ncbi:hypothetical protein Psta_1351 [Pirellula staleyi DSM 6068]|uniref:Uncharacterized protein n=1 Tax=Pirellula staleyi (strain ATCC 27377 / DSM 6068 / ICPB 4128) TaxID=530564 RepID=D2QWS4_PIRSD|nr:hypothetical protein [Pirellula staleyi]ADB16028.1 hypothetical protein Psta_1351 [Pirellula staleyi DSM 6068]